MSKLTKERERLDGTIKGTIIPDIMEEMGIPESLANRHSEILELTEDRSTLRNKIDNLKAQVDAELANETKDAEIKKHQLLEWTRNEYACVTIDKDISVIEGKLKPDATAMQEYLTSLPRPDTSKIEELTNYADTLEAILQKLRWEMEETKKLYKTFSADALETICTSCNSPLDKAHAAKEAEAKKQIFISSKADRDTKDMELANAKLELGKLSVSAKNYKDAEQQVEIAEQAVVYAERALAKKQADLAKALSVPIEFVLSAKPMIDLLSAKPMINLLSAKPMINLEESTKDFNEKIDAIAILIAQIRQDISARDNEIQRAQEHNLEVVRNNMKRDILLETFNAATLDIKGVTEEEIALQVRLTNIDVLAKVFGPKGLIAYKLESCVKVFENKVNQYLTEVSNGKFALGFELDEANLKVVMYSSGKQVNIKTLSSGELSKVNISTLLSIRSLMSAVSKNSLNALFLDEVVSTIDEDGMEDLIEVLIKEHNLNTFVVSHNYQHPLVEVLKVIKENDISRLENGDWS
jgi:hypothetical protein